MKKRGMSSLVLIILAITILLLAGLTYYYTTKEKVELTHEEKEIAGSLDLTPEEFKEVSTKAEEFFKNDRPNYEEGLLLYYNVDEEDIKDYYIKGGTGITEKIEPGSEIIVVSYGHSLPPKSVLYSVNKDGELTVLKEGFQIEPY